MERKRYFLRYSDGVNHAKYVYVDAFENGRCIGVTTDMPLESGNLRETLLERAALSKFNHVLVQLVGEGTGQHTVGRISQSSVLFQLLSEVEIAPWSIDDGNVFYFEFYSKPKAGLMDCFHLLQRKTWCQWILITTTRTLICTKSAKPLDNSLCLAVWNTLTSRRCAIIIMF